MTSYYASSTNGFDKTTDFGYIPKVRSADSYPLFAVNNEVIV